MIPARRFVTTVDFVDERWTWDRYRAVVKFLAVSLHVRRSVSVTLVDSAGEICTRSVGDAERRTRAAGANPLTLRVEVIRRLGAAATLTVVASEQGAHGSVRFTSADEIQAAGLKAALLDRLTRTLDDAPDERQVGTSRLVAGARALLTNRWFVGLSTGVVAGWIVLLLKR